MNAIYQVTVRGKRLESRDLRKLLARAVAEKRTMDEKLRLFAGLRKGTIPSVGGAAPREYCVGEVSGR
jgi:hypothetical protein